MKYSHPLYDCGGEGHGPDVSAFSACHDCNPYHCYPDWTRDLYGRSNNGERYLFLVKEVVRMIREDAHFLLSGKTETTARLIVSQLAHKYGLAPTQEEFERR